MTKRNTQAPEPVKRDNGGNLDVVDVWHTIQGEGPLMGAPAVFIRLFGCNLQCDLCDTDYTSRKSSHTPAELLDTVVGLTTGNKTRTVVITGGEPFRQNVVPVALKLLAEGYTVQFETNGTLPIPEQLTIPDPRLVVVVSPKTSVVHASVQRRADCYKFVLSKGNVDGRGLPTRVLGTKTNFTDLVIPAHVPVIVQPLDDPAGGWDMQNGHRAACVGAALRHGYRVCLQIHKLLSVA